MKSLKGFFVFVILLLVFLVLLGSRPFFGRIYQKIETAADNIFVGRNVKEELAELKMENARLKFELSGLQVYKLEEDYNFLHSFLYSRYPFNDRELIIIDVGKKNGVEVGAPVFTTEDFLVGKVIRVRNNQSEVQTIFDSRWKNSVAVGDLTNKAVFLGGAKPVLDLVPKESRIKPGDSVFNIAPEFPLRALIGRVKEVKKDADFPWLKVEIEIPYNIEDITEVKVLLDFP